MFLVVKSMFFVVTNF